MMRILWPIYNLQIEHNQYPGIMSVSSVLKQNGFEVEVVAADFEQVKEKLENMTSTILAYSTPTAYSRYYLQLNNEIKRRFPGVTSVFGGSHPTFFPEMVEEEGVDAICIGEGEYPMLELVNNLAAGRMVKNIQNWWVKENGKIYKNPVRPLIENLDDLPIPDHKIFRQAMPRTVSQAVVMTSRGCPYRCTYCYNHAYRQIYKGKGTAIRRRSVDHVIEELRRIKDTNCQFIRFMDDLFILSRQWVEEFSKKYKKQIGLPFSCMVRANYVTADIVRMLKEAGCYRMLMGVEAGNDYVRNAILKRNMTTEEIINAAKLIKKGGVKLVTANIVAIPGGSLQADWETLQLNIRCRPNYASVAILQPYPRTEIYRYAKAKNLIDEKQLDIIKSSFGFGLRTDLKLKNKEKCLIENLHKFFPIAIRFPFTLPLIRQLIKLPPNKIFNFIYLCSVNYGIHLKAVPPRIGLPILWRRIRMYKLFRRIVKRKSKSK